MVGRIVVGAPAPVDAGRSAGNGLTPLPAAALNGFPSVEEIVAKGVVRRELRAEKRKCRHADGSPSTAAELGDHSDEELVALARQGGENAIRALIKRNNRRLFRVARAVMRNDAEAEDVVQETYVQAFTKLDTFRGELRSSQPGSRGSLSTRRWGACAVSGRPPNLQNWTSVPRPKEGQ